MDEHTAAPLAPTLLTRWRALALPAKIILGVIIFVVVLIAFTFLRILLSYSSFGTSRYGDDASMLSAPSFGGGASNKVSSRVSMEYDSYQQEMYPPTPYPTSGGTGTYDETAYETRSYTAHVKTRSYKEACGAMEGLKPLPDVVFEEAVKGDSLCSYRFKVVQASVPAVLDAIEKLNPRNLSEQTEVVKRQLEQYTTRLDVLVKKEKLLAETLDGVNTDYNELLALSKNVGDVKTYASVIDDKTRYIIDLSQKRLDVSSQLEAIAQQKADLADRIAYVYFNVSIEKIEYVDAKDLKDSWMYAVRTFIQDANETLQSITLGMLALVLLLVEFLLQAIVVFTVVLVVAKVGWRATKHFWQS